jgi:hypothetical protein
MHARAVQTTTKKAGALLCDGSDRERPLGVLLKLRVAAESIRNHLTIIIINIHLLPSWTTAQKIDIFQRIRSLLPAYGNAAWFLAGDLNISYDGSIDIRDDVDNDGALRGRKLLTDMLNILEEPTELFQPFPTF